MEPEQKRSFEDIVNRNLASMMAHGNETRKMVRELEEQVKRLDGNVRTLTELIEGFRTQIGHLQQKLYVGGTSGG